MTNIIKISEKDKVFQIATKKGWVEMYGIQVTIDGICFAIYPQKYENNTCIQVSEVESGATVLIYQFAFIGLLMLDTRDKTIEYYKDKIIPLIQKKIEVNGLDKFRKAVEKAKNYMIETHGERPEIKDIEEENE
ncbi:hypothetical protein HCA89_11110 [Listeria innocua]|uniref:Uncharacterized protein n=1 Tax=Listeria innocua TaxID=1642 RepID=A0AB73H9J2_LISIO|nr:hypothetical protein [Listeria innocua]MBC2142862.1 hypothetical protein [Listeria innocua]